jgi:hypothetical protein
VQSQVYASLPHLRVLRFHSQVLDRCTFRGMQDAAEVPSKLHTIDIVDCRDRGGEALSLRSMRSLKSLSRIRFARGDLFTDGERPVELSGVVKIIHSPGLRFSDFALLFL